MKKTFFFVLLFIALCSISIVYLHLTYPEQKWITKTVLDLPKLNTPPKIITNNKKYPSPSADLLIKNNDSFVIFDSKALSVLSLETPWSEQKNAAHEYGKKVIRHTGNSSVSIILTGVGINEGDFQTALQKLPTSVSLSFSPYALDLDKKVERARLKGFENMFDLPVDTPYLFFEGGAYALNENMPFFKMKALLDFYYNANIPFVGFVAPQLKSKNFNAILSNDIKDKGLIFIDLNKAETLPSNLFYPEAIDAFLKEKTQTTPTNQERIIVLPLTKLTIDAIASWVGTKDLQNVDFIPASALNKN